MKLINVSNMPYSQFDSKDSGTIFDKGNKAPPFLNPGNLSKLHKKCQDISPIYIDGIEFVLQDSRKPGRILFCNARLSESSPTGLRLGLAVNRSKDETVFKSPSFALDINPYTFSTNILFSYHILPSTRIKWRAQAIPTNFVNPFADPYFVNKQFFQSFSFNSNILSLDYYRKASTVSLNAYNVTNKSGQMTLSCLTNVSACWSIGSELLFEWANEELSANTALAARYTSNKSVYAGTVSLTRGDLDLSYYRQINDSFQIGTSLVFNRRLSKAIGSIFYQWYFRDGIIRAKLDSNGSVGFTYKRKIDFMNYDFGLSVLMSIPTNRLMCGFTMDLNVF